MSVFTFYFFCCTLFSCRLRAVHVGFRAYDKIASRIVSYRSPQICHFLWGDLEPHLGFQAHPSPYPKRRLNRFGRFCTPYHFTQPPNSYGLHLTTIFNKPRTLLKSAPCFCGIWTPTNARFFGITLHIDLAYRLTGRNMQKQWQSRNKTKLYLRRVFVLPIMLYGSECWAINKADIQRIDAVDKWCLRRILDIRWHEFITNANTRRTANQPRLSSIIKSFRLTFFGHLA